MSGPDDERAPQADFASRTRYDFSVLDRVWGAEELEAMTPDERQRIVQASMVDDWSKLPAPLVERLRRRGEELLRERGLLDPAS